MISSSHARRAYMMARLRLLHEGQVLTGTPEEYIERHEAANAERAAARLAQVHLDDNMDLIGGVNG